MKRFWMVVGVAVLVGLLGVALLGAVAFAQDDDGADWPFDFPQRLHEAIAGVLGISVEEYDSAVDTARDQVLGEAVSEGWLTREQADRMAERAAEGFGPGMRGGSFGRRGGPGFMGRGETSLVTVVAGALGMTTEDLVAELQDGKSIADVAAEQGVELQAIADAYIARRTEGLDAAVEEGRITQEQADWMLEHMSEEVLEHLEGEMPLGGRGPGCGHGGGFDRGGMNHWNLPALPGESES